jgi:hypothetical protein
MGASRCRPAGFTWICKTAWQLDRLTPREVNRKSSIAFVESRRRGDSIEAAAPF